MIRVLHTIDTTGPGGAETVFIHLVKGLDRNRFHPFAAIRGSGWVCDTLRKTGIEPIFVPSRGAFNIRYLVSLVRVIRSHRIDLIQSHLLGSNLYCSLAGLICGVPVISTFHGFVDTSETERFMRTKSRLINLGSDKIVFVSERLRAHYIRRHGISPEKAVTIYNGVDTSVFRPQEDDTIRKELGLGPQHVLVGALGNIRPAKGYDVFLRAARLVHDKHPDCRFVIAGQGAGELYEALLKVREALNLQKVFFVLGFRPDAARVLNNLDIFVLPSVSEGFSISTIEAMACGIPVVATRSGGPEEIVSNGNDGVLVKCSDVDLADAINAYIGNPTLMRTFARNAYNEVLEEYSLSSMFKQYVDCYQQVVHSFRVGRSR